MTKCLIGISFLLLMACDGESPSAYRFPYSLHQPTQVYDLPPTLREVSGLSFFSENQMACIQDEAGIIYFFDTEQEKVIHKVDFQVFDDFEGVEIVNGDGFALTSKGDFYTIPNLRNVPTHRKIDLGTYANFESLGYDAEARKFLILPKKELSKGKILLFSTSIDEPRMVLQFELTNQNIRTFCKKKGIKYRVKGKHFPFAPSGVAVHPQTKEIYILSSKGKTLCVLSSEGKLLHLEVLDEELLPKPEGIAFMPSGELFIASEGEERGKMVRFEPLQQPVQ